MMRLIKEVSTLFHFACQLKTRKGNKTEILLAGQKAGLCRLDSSFEQPESILHYFELIFF